MKTWQINIIRCITSIVFFAICAYIFDFLLSAWTTSNNFSIIGNKTNTLDILKYKDYVALAAGLAATIPFFIKMNVWIVKSALWLNKKRSTKKKMKHSKDCNAGGECECAINMGEQANRGFVRDDSSTATRLLDKNWSPLIVRKYQMEGWPMYIGIICDANLNDLDVLVYDIIDEAKENDFINGTIQGVRNTCGLLSDRIVEHYNKVKRGVAEGVIVCWYVDKCFVSSAYGDFMTHEKCAAEFYHIVNTLPHI